MLRKYYQRVSETLDAQTVARSMIERQLLTQSELDSIHSRRKEPTAAAKELLNIVIDQTPAVYHCFLDALNVTGHEHVHDLIVTGNITGTK